MKVKEVTVTSEVKGGYTKPVDVSKTKVYDTRWEEPIEVIAGLERCPQCGALYPEPVDLGTRGVAQKECKVCGSLNMYQRRTFEKED